MRSATFETGQTIPSLLIASLQYRRLIGNFCNWQKILHIVSLQMQLFKKLRNLLSYLGKLGLTPTTLTFKRFKKIIISYSTPFTSWRVFNLVLVFRPKAWEPVAAYKRVLGHELESMILVIIFLYVHADYVPVIKKL
jgi:hypothetical protein